MPMSAVLPERLLGVLDDLAQVIVPQAYEESASAAGLRVLLAARVAAMPAHVRTGVVAALRVLAFAPARGLVHGRLAMWHKLDLALRAECFAIWGTCRLSLIRAIYQAVRRLVLSTYYGTPSAHRDIGVLPPLHQRLPQLEWEGPLPSPTPGIEGPVARADRSVPVPRANPVRQPAPYEVTLGSGLSGTFRLSADVVVIGSGAGGAVAASVLAKAGREVVILEEGSHFAAADFTEDEATLFPRLYADCGYRATDDGSVALLQGCAVGGGSLVNWMIMLRTPAHVLDEWSRRFGLTGFSVEHMARALDSVEREVSAGLVTDRAHSPTNRVILDGANALGWRASAAMINAVGCVRAGTCSLGCRYGAKQSVARTYLLDAFQHGARLFADARVHRIAIRERSTNGNHAPLKEVHATARNAATGEPTASILIEAPIVVLAAGGVGTPVILQRSGMGGGVVGRYLRLHPA